jgi:hypothetical protein
LAPQGCVADCGPRSRTCECARSGPPQRLPLERHPPISRSVAPQDRVAYCGPQRDCVSEAVCTPSSVPRFLAEMAIHLRPPVARRLMRPTRGLGSAPLPHRRSPADGLRPPIWPCSGWSLPVSLRTPTCAGIRHRHCGTGPRLTAGGRYPPPCAAELGLSSRHGRLPRRDARPSDRLADPTILPVEAAGGLRSLGEPSITRPVDDRRRTTRRDPIDRLVGERVRDRVQRARDVRGGPAVQASQGRPGR